MVQNTRGTDPWKLGLDVEDEWKAWILAASPVMSFTQLLALGEEKMWIVETGGGDEFIGGMRVSWQGRPGSPSRHLGIQMKSLTG